MKQQINFYQAQFRPKQVIFPAKQVGIVALVTLLIVLLVAFYIAQQIATQKQTFDVLQQRVETNKKQLAELENELSLRKEDPLLLAQFDDLQKRIAAKKAIYQYLSSHQFGNRTGFSGSLKALSVQHIDDVWLTEFALMNGGESLHLIGKVSRSELIPNYIDSLALNQQFHGKQFSAVEIQQPNSSTEHYQFSLKSKVSNEVLK
jgi:Tfp pilus assembly protein PilN